MQESNGQCELESGAGTRVEYVLTQGVERLLRPAASIRHGRAKLRPHVLDATSLSHSSRLGKPSPGPGVGGSIKLSRVSPYATDRSDTAKSLLGAFPCARRISTRPGARLSFSCSVSSARAFIDVGRLVHARRGCRRRIGPKHRDRTYARSSIGIGSCICTHARTHTGNDEMVLRARPSCPPRPSAV